MSSELVYKCDVCNKMGESQDFFHIVIRHYKLEYNKSMDICSECWLKSLPPIDLEDE